jgi:hypothetical protein
MRSNWQTRISIVTVILLCSASCTFAAPPVISWSTQFGTTSYDDASGVSFDHLGHVYVTGTTDGVLGQTNFGGDDAYLAKYDLDGNQIWRQQFGSIGNDIGVKVAADSSGSTFVIGRTRGELAGANAGGLDSFISKYDASGTALWTRQFGSAGDEFASHLTVDPFGNALVVGRTSGSVAAFNAGNFDALVTKYDGNGNQQWSRQFGTSAWDESFGVASDAFGNVFVVGDTQGSLDGPFLGSQDIFLRKYDVNGTLIWRKQFGTIAWDKSFEAVADDQGNVYFTGWSRGNLPGPNAGQYDAIIEKYNSDGNLLWARQFGTSNYDYAFAISLDSAGNVYVGGQEDVVDLVAEPVGGSAFLAKYSASGDFAWKKRFTTSGDQHIFGVAGEGAGTAYAVGRTTGDLFGPNSGDYDAFIAKVADVPEPASISLLMIAVLWKVFRSNPRGLRVGF